MGLLRRIPQSGIPDQAAAAPPSAPEADSGYAGVVGPDPRAQLQGAVGLRELKDRVRRQIIDELQSGLELPKESNLHERIKALFGPVLDAEQIRLSETDRDQLLAAVIADLTGFGPAEPLIKDPAIDEILVVGHSNVYVRYDDRIVPSDVQFDDEAHLRLYIDRAAQRSGQRLDEANPLWQGWLPDGSAIRVAVPPASAGGAVVAIQKQAARHFSAVELVQAQSLTDDMIKLLQACVLARLNVLVTGAPASGKTTLLQLLRSFIPATESALLVQVGESHDRATEAGTVVLVGRSSNATGQGEIPPRALLQHALTLHPARIVLERCIGAEAREMLEAMARGVGGWMTTVEGSSPQSALSWLEHLAGSTDSALAPGRIAGWIGEAVDVVAHTERLTDGSRKVTSICEVRGIGETGQPMLQDIFVFDQRRTDREGTGQFRAIGKPSRLQERVERAGIPFPALESA
jgi:pilus assembly protein CpaF